MASIEKRGKNSFRLIVEAGYDADGKREKRTKTMRIDDEALLKTTKRLNDYLNGELMKFRMEIESGEYISPDKMTFYDFAEKEWLKKFAEKNYSPANFKNVCNRLKTHIYPAFGHYRLDQIKTIHIVNFIHNLERPGSRRDGKGEMISGYTVVNIYKTLKSILSCANEWRIISTNPIDGTKQPKVTQKKMKFYEENEVQVVIKALYQEPNVWRLYFLAAMIGGFRRGELLALEWTDVNFEENTLDIQKSISLTEKGQAVVKKPKTEASERIVVMPEWFMRELRQFHLEWKKERLQIGDLWQGGDHQYVFQNGLGKPYYSSTPSTTWRKFLVKHEFRTIRLHDLRHTSATLLIESGVTMKAVQERLGHTKYQTTADLYAHVTKKVSQETAAKLDKFDPNNFVPNSSPSSK